MPKDSYLIPPEGEDDDNEDEDLADEVLEAAAKARSNLITKNKNGNVIEQIFQ